tara:strand:- start:5306 stop:5491 length:186 start_codon:yes stop_codon:yes gene_type:complete
MNKDEINELVLLRTNLIAEFNKLRDYKNNPNAIMKEIDHARKLHEIITSIDSLIKPHVEFK